MSKLKFMDTVYKCVLCNEYFDTEEEAEEHEQYEHRGRR